MTFFFLLIAGGIVHVALSKYLETKNEKEEQTRC